MTQTFVRATKRRASFRGEDTMAERLPLHILGEVKIIFYSRNHEDEIVSQLLV